MATTDELTQQINTLTARLNSIENNSKKIGNLTLKTPVEITDELPIAGNKKITLQQISDVVTNNLTTLLNSKEDKLRNLVQVSSNYTILEDDFTIECTSGSFPVTLPTAVGIAGKMYNIVNSGNGIITLDGNGSETINGSLTQPINVEDSITVQSNGANWIVL